jgi:hypothetical protein
MEDCREQVYNSGILDKIPDAEGKVSADAVAVFKEFTVIYPNKSLKGVR